jgi:DNA-binding response OmpR family regulator
VALYSVFVLVERDGELGEIPWESSSQGISYNVGTGEALDDSLNGNVELKPDAVLVDIGFLSQEANREMVSHCQELGLPVVASVRVDHLAEYHPSLSLDDFIILPFRSEELVARLEQAIFRRKGLQSQDAISAGDLFIDLQQYEVRLRGRRVMLTYKEYQLLVLLASNPGRVYSRDTLLSQVWGYDYFGGTRTVDVHIRRLRSKIEDATHSFIETIWNVGYRFTGTP